MFWETSSTVRAVRLHREGSRFESVVSHHYVLSKPLVMKLKFDDLSFLGDGSARVDRSFTYFQQVGAIPTLPTISGL